MDHVIEATRGTVKSLGLFLLIAFGLAWILFLLPLAFGEPASPARQAASLVTWSAAMWAPGIAAIIATLRVDREPMSTLGLNRLGERKMYLWAWLAPPVLTVIAGALTLLFGAATADWQFTALREALAKSNTVTLPPTFYVLIQLFAGLTVGPLFNTLFALGEELGWRAYLLPKLMAIFRGPSGDLKAGQIPAIVLSGAIWGVWHAPAIIQGHNYPGHPFIGPFLMIGFCILGGAFFCWLYLRTRSAWAPALGHASLNAIAGLPLLVMPKVDLAIGGTLAGVIGWIPLALLGAWLLWSKRLPVEMPSEEEGEE